MWISFGLPNVGSLKNPFCICHPIFYIGKEGRNKLPISILMNSGQCKDFNTTEQMSTNFMQILEHICLL